MNIKDIKKGEESNYMLFVVHSSVGGYFWHDMAWTKMDEGGFWEPVAYRGICSFRTKEECVSNMRAEVPGLMEECEQVGGTNEEDDYMLFRLQHN